jgi:hypothetical protein
MTNVLFLELAFVILILISLGIVFTLERRFDKLFATYNALRADIEMTLLEIDNEVKLDPTDPDFSAGRAMGLRQAQHMFEAVLERDTRRGKYGD